jgi:copper homeostasis protein
MTRALSRFTFRPTFHPMLIEACVDSLPSARFAASAGADRLELCAELDLEGTTPDFSVISDVLSQVSIPVHVIIRPRGGDFVHTVDELATMEREIRHVHRLGAHGVVFGVLTRSGEIDRDATARLRDAAGDLPATFHKAFDAVPDQLAALDILIESGIERVLTSGGKSTAWEGRHTLAEVVRRSAGRITVMAGGAIDETHVADLIRETGVKEIHLRGTKAREDRFRRVVERVKPER